MHGMSLIMTCGQKGSSGGTCNKSGRKGPAPFVTVSTFVPRCPDRNVYGFILVVEW